eukprot:5181474-Lingulodinium_polyedra.AAC.1
MVPSLRRRARQGACSSQAATGWAADRLPRLSLPHRAGPDQGVPGGVLDRPLGGGPRLAGMHGDRVREEGRPGQGGSSRRGSVDRGPGPPEAEAARRW